MIQRAACTLKGNIAQKQGGIFTCFGILMFQKSQKKFLMFTDKRLQLQYAFFVLFRTDMILFL